MASLTDDNAADGNLDKRNIWLIGAGHTSPCASFFSGRQQRNCLSRFSVLVFGGGFLAECRHPRGNGHGCPFQSDAAWMPLEDDRSLRHTFSFCLETSSRKKCTENRDRQFRCCRPLKKLAHGRPPPNTTFSLNYSAFSVLFCKTCLTNFCSLVIIDKV